ncbi:MAG: hypothetical protein LBG84_08470 [Treponema sp.]|jgi:hypothetical protein|nr:hypothetical protein [Treponema sp.]
MIFSTGHKDSLEAVSSLLEETTALLIKDAENNQEEFARQDAAQFEKRFYHAIKTAAANTPFKDTVKFMGGHKFPDVIIDNRCGVEVKTTKQNQWISTGNSVLETTRIEGMENIFIYFAKLDAPAGFKYRKYQDCLYDIAVTHSPRYLINMDLERGKSIFDKMKIDYNQFRNLESPIKTYINYLRKNLKPGEEPWWINNEDENAVRPVIRIYSKLDREEKNKIVTEAFILFPEIFGNSPVKYQRLSTWLVTKHGVVDPSLRDRFTAGGRTDITMGNNIYRRVPRIFKVLSGTISSVARVIETMPDDLLRHYWKERYAPGIPPFESWGRQLLFFGKKTLRGNEGLLTDLLGAGYSRL